MGDVFLVRKKNQTIGWRETALRRTSKLVELIASFPPFFTFSPVLVEERLAGAL